MLRLTLLSTLAVVLLSIAGPASANPDLNQNATITDKTQMSSSSPAEKKMTLSASVLVPFGMQYDIQARLAPHWSIGLQAFQMPDIISSIITDKDQELWSYGVSARYYILHDFGTTGFYISPTLQVLTQDSADKGDNKYFGLGELTLGFQWPILNYVGLNLSASVIADLGKHNSDDSRFAGLFSAGIDVLF